MIELFRVFMLMHHRYTRMDGTQCMRIVTTKRKLTSERSVAEEGCDVAVVALNAIQRSAHLALQRDLEEARGTLLSSC